MRFQRQESFALGELALFAVAWLLAIATALDDYQGRSNNAAKDSVAAIGDETQSFGILE